MTDAELVVIGGRYEMLKRLGTGGMAEVWLAADLRLNRKEVALKRLLGFRADSPSSAQDLQRVRREAFSASRVSHPNLVAVTDFVAENDEPFIVMEYVPGDNLADLTSSGGIAPARAAKIMSQVASALADVHAAGLVHRDIKPANIMLDARGNAKVADFGIARGAEDPRFTATGFFTGTISYLAPELLTGGDATPASDMWSFGATLFEILEGRRAFDGPTTPAILISVASGEVPRPVSAGPLADVVGSLLDRTPDRRPTAEDVADTLAEIATQLGGARRKPVPPTVIEPGPTAQPPPPATPAQPATPPPIRLPPPTAAPLIGPPAPGVTSQPSYALSPPTFSSGPTPVVSHQPPPRTGPPVPVQHSWQQHPPAFGVPAASAYPAPAGKPSRTLWVVFGLLLVAGVVAVIVIVANSGGSDPPPVKSGTAIAVFDEFASDLRAHDLDGMRSTLCSDVEGFIGSTTQANLDQLSDVVTVSEPGSDDVGQLNITVAANGAQSTSQYAVTMADESGFCVKDVERQG